MQHYDLRRSAPALPPTSPQAPVSSDHGGSTGYIDPADLGPGPRGRMLWAYGMGDAGTGMAASLIGF